MYDDVRSTVTIHVREAGPITLAPTRQTNADTGQRRPRRKRNDPTNSGKTAMRVIQLPSAHAQSAQVARGPEHPPVETPIRLRSVLTSHPTAMAFVSAQAVCCVKPPLASAIAGFA
jgi:hypothetical protein